MLTSNRRPNAAVVLAALLASAGWLAPSVGRAQQDVQKQVEKLNRKAMEDYDLLEFDSARQTLLGNIAKLRDAGLDETPTAAATYMDLGLVYIAGFKDKNRGIQQFVNALKIEPSLQLDPVRATPELQEAFEQASKQAGAGGARGKRPPSDGNGGGSAGGEEVAPTVDPKGMQHTPVDEAKRGQRVAIRARVGASVKAARVFLFYRRDGQEDYVAVPMEKGEGGEWTADIPGSAVAGRSVQYYLEARDARGRAVVGSSSAASPYIISVAAPPGGDEEHNPLLDGRPRTARPEDTRGRGFGRLFLAVMPGIGIGVQPEGNHTEVAWQYNAPTMRYRPQPVGSTGVVFAPFHVAVEAGVQITNAISVSGLARLELVTGANADSSMSAPLGGGTARATGAVAGLLRLRYRFGSGRFHPYLQVNAGGGEIRHALDVTSAEDRDRRLVDQSTAEKYNAQYAKTKMTDPPTTYNDVCLNQTQCVDTIVMRYVFVGAGGGLWIDLLPWKNGALGFVVDVNALFAFGDQFGMNIDVEGGLGIHFL